jgi:diaminohydroxyphosphoribosylaminopyrimidine deaminase/5-amino-6-(5-phosphoribosylamino)uracil reductase
MVGIGTAIADDPLLTVRDAPHNGHQPTRVIVDRQARLPATAAMLRESGQTIVATAGAGRERAETLERAGAQVIDTGPGLQVDIDALLRELGRRDITSVLVEGGAELLGNLFDRRVIDKFVVVVAPIVIGGDEAPGPVKGVGSQTMQDVLRLEGVRYEQMGGDMVIIGYPAPLKKAARRKRGH